MKTVKTRDEKKIYNSPIPHKPKNQTEYCYCKKCMKWWKGKLCSPPK